MEQAHCQSPRSGRPVSWISKGPLILGIWSRTDDVLIVIVGARGRRAGFVDGAGGTV